METGVLGVLFGTVSMKLKHSMVPLSRGPDRPACQIRIFRVEDLPRVLAIEAECSVNPWTIDEFRARMGRTNTIGMVAVREDAVVGFLIASCDPAAYSILRLATTRPARRSGIGSALVAELQNHAQCSERLIRVDLPEHLLGAHLFLGRNGFVCDGILRPADEVSTPVYRFVWTTYRELLTGDGATEL